jgi:predicted DCC family thiol-disulfide oxidoreductase YuxK
MHSSLQSGPEPAIGALTVYYDGACPLCRREIGVYQGLSPCEPVRWVDVSDAAAPLPAGADRPTLLARFHVQRADGALVSGARGFVALWATMPGWRWLARLASVPGAAPVMEWAYCGFLRARPALQRLAHRFEPASKGPA